MKKLLLAVLLLISFGLQAQSLVEIEDPTKDRHLFNISHASVGYVNQEGNATKLPMKGVLEISDTYIILYQSDFPAITFMTDYSEKKESKDKNGNVSVVTYMGNGFQVLSREKLVCTLVISHINGTILFTTMNEKGNTVTYWSQKEN